MMGKSQTDIAYGLPALPRADPAYYAWWLMNTVLGEFALGGRQLRWNVRYDGSKTFLNGQRWLREQSKACR